MSAPQYIPLSAGQSATSNISSPANAGVSSQGTSASTLQTDFDALGGYLDTIIGSNPSSSVTNNGTNTFGKAYFYNTGSKCSITPNKYSAYCPIPDGDDSVYEYIYINTISQGLMPGIASGTEKILELPATITNVLVETSPTSSCECVPLNVRDSDGTQQCAAAFISSSNMSDSDIQNNICTNDIIETLYSSGVSSGSSGGSGFSGGSGATSKFSSLGSGLGGSSKSGGGLFSSLDEGFTTMTIQKIYKNIDRLFLIGLSILLIILLYRIGLK